MTELNRNRIAWNYTDDNGTVWRVAAQKALTDQAKLGGTASSGAVPPRPNWGKMRRVTVSNAAGQSRVLPCYTIDAPIVSAGETINANFGMDSAAFTSNGGFINEDKQGSRVTKQTT
jgi:hypothetical protein